MSKRTKLVGVDRSCHRRLPPAEGFRVASPIEDLRHRALLAGCCSHCSTAMASAGSMLSGNAPARPQPTPAPREPLPTVEDLTVDVEGKTPFALCRVVQNASEVIFLHSKP